MLNPNSFDHNHTTSTSNSSSPSSSSTTTTSAHMNTMSYKKASTRAIAIQLRKLAGDAQGAAYLSAETACLIGLCSLIHVDENYDQETTLIALQAVVLLAAHEISAKALRRHAQLSVRLAVLANSEQELIASVAKAALDAIHFDANTPQQHFALSDGNLPRQNLADSSNTNFAPSSAPVIQGTSIHHAYIHSRAVDSATERVGTRYLSSLTFSASRKGFNEGVASELIPSERSMLEQRLICINGVVSVSVSRQGTVNMHCKAGCDLHLIQKQCEERAHPRFTISLSSSPIASTNILSENASPSSVDNSDCENNPALVNFSSTSAQIVQVEEKRRDVHIDKVSAPSTPLAWSSSRAIILATNSVEGASLQSRAQTRRQHVIHAQEKKHVAQSLFSSVSSFFW